MITLEKKLINAAANLGIEIFFDNELYSAWENSDFLGNGNLDFVKEIIRQKSNEVEYKKSLIAEEIEKRNKKAKEQAKAEQKRNILIDSLTKKHTTAVALDEFENIIGFCYAEGNTIRLAKCVYNNREIDVKTVKISKSKRNLKKAEQLGCDFLNRHLLNDNEFCYTVN